MHPKVANVLQDALLSWSVLIVLNANLYYEALAINGQAAAGGDPFACFGGHSFDDGTLLNRDFEDKALKERVRSSIIIEELAPIDDDEEDMIAPALAAVDGITKAARTVLDVQARSVDALRKSLLAETAGGIAGH